jgi:transglutaminase-like putative cysteine protease
LRFKILLGLLLALSLPGAEKPPQWLAEVAGRATPAYKDTVGAAVLFNEERVELQPDGRVVTTVRRAVKILSRAGQQKAEAHVVYRTDTGKVKSLRAWLIYPSGGVKTYDKKETVDVALNENDVYNEARVRAIIATDHAQPGAVFGYEAVSDDRSIFTQFTYEFQDELPALRSRFVLALPAGWEVSSHTFNHEPVAPDVSGSQYLWQLDNLEPIELEPASPSLHSIAPWLAVSYAPPAGAAGSAGPVFKDWASVSSWLAELNNRSVAGNESVSAKARELTSASGSELDRIRAIGAYVQAIKYVSIQTGVGRGGGYQPHPAPEVLSKSYGDCKDKANLMRSLLAAAGIEAYPVAIFSGDPHYVRESWSSPQQFNHAIIAVRVSPETEAPAVGVHESLGRLLFFDPTDSATLVGFLVRPPRLGSTPRTNSLS